MEPHMSVYDVGPTYEHLPSKYNFNPLEVVPRYGEPQLQVGENYS